MDTGAISHLMIQSCIYLKKCNMTHFLAIECMKDVYTTDTSKIMMIVIIASYNNIEV